MDIETSNNIFELAQNHKYAIFELAESGGTALVWGFYEDLCELNKDFAEIKKKTSEKARQFLMVEIRDVYDEKVNNEEQWLVNQIGMMEKKEECLNKTLESFKERLSEIREVK